jgi:hypothetical protein
MHPNPIRYYCYPRFLVFFEYLLFIRLHRIRSFLQIPFFSAPKWDCFSILGDIELSGTRRSHGSMAKAERSAPVPGVSVLLAVKRTNEGRARIP